MGIEQQQVVGEAASRLLVPVVAMLAPRWTLQLAQAAEEERLPLVLPWVGTWTLSRTLN